MSRTGVAGEPDHGVAVEGVTLAVGARGQVTDLTSPPSLGEWTGGTVYVHERHGVRALDNHTMP